MRRGIYALALALCVGRSAIAQSDQSVVPDKATKARLENIVKGILHAWDTYDVVCLGEGHGDKNDSDLRISLVEHPDFSRKVKSIIVESADSLQQALLDRFILDGENLSREQLRAVWKETSGKEVWELPIYEAFLRTVRSVNSTLPRNERIRVIAGDNSNQRNRGKFIRDAVSHEILSKGMKALAIYGSGHCERRGMGFPGELSEEYPGRIWSAATFHNPDEGRRIFGLGDEPELIQITGTNKEKLPAAGMFVPRNASDHTSLANLFDAIVYYGDMTQTKAGRVP